MPLTASWTATWMMAMTRVCWTGARAGAAVKVRVAACWFHSITASPGANGCGTKRFRFVRAAHVTDDSGRAVLPAPHASLAAEYAVTPRRAAPKPAAITSRLVSVLAFMSGLLYFVSGGGLHGRPEARVRACLLPRYRPRVIEL